ncbi:MAG TPA: CBS domain-containing protein [Burkholderiaceae bacterium]|nr:CBS domain-containing protein [Burkholderiaceae bacterium]
MRTPTTAVRDLAIHKVVTVTSNTTLRDCAQTMREEHVGSVVIVDPGSPRPLGIITDRDIVIEAVAVGLDVTTLTAGDIAAKPVITIRDDEDVLDALARMRENGVRRLPVTGPQGHLSGVLSIDDLLAVLSEQFDSIVRVMVAERTKEGATRR